MTSEQSILSVPVVAPAKSSNLTLSKCAEMERCTKKMFRNRHLYYWKKSEKDVDVPKKTFWKWRPERDGVVKSGRRTTEMKSESAVYKLYIFQNNTRLSAAKQRQFWNQFIDDIKNKTKRSLTRRSSAADERRRGAVVGWTHDKTVH